MKVYEDIIIKNDDYIVVGFINSNNELEYTEYKAVDGGTFSLDENEKYSKKNLEKILEENILKN